MKSALYYTIIGVLLMNSYTIKKEDVRTLFHQGMSSEEKLEAIVSLNSDSDDFVTMGYKGVSEAMLAKHVFFPTAKLNHFKRGKLKIEKAISMDSGNIELRYLRLLVQLNVPPILGYHKNISEDIQFFMEHIDDREITIQWKHTFINNLIAGKYLSDEQRMDLEAIDRHLK
ncbi:hypothetical protein [Leptobacterium sp. I13]|uniref:hypothetical protein n=1 Tax=Leptobacterium meishanense TaxID=3128904 RepID=UPI0030EC0343